MNGSNENLVSCSPSYTLDEKVNLLQEKIQAEFATFKKDLYESPCLMFASPNMTHSYMQAYHYLMECLSDDHFPEEIIDASLKSDNILMLAYNKWNDLYANLLPTIEEGFVADFTQSLTSDQNRQTIRTLYNEKSDIDHLTKKAINSCIAHMGINQCKVYAECLRLDPALNPIRVTDIAETVEQFFSDDPEEILAQTTETVDAQERGFIAVAAHCQAGSTANNFVNQILIVDPTKLKSNYRGIENQLFFAQSGFGCSSNANGTSVFAENIYTNHKERWLRSDFLGIADIERLPEEAQEAIHHYMTFHNTLNEDNELEV